MKFRYYMDRFIQREPALRAVLMVLGAVLLAGQLALAPRARPLASAVRGSWAAGLAGPQDSFLARRLADDCLVSAIIQVESGGDARKTGRAGERGVMQIKRGTWREMTRTFLGEAISFDRAFEPDLNETIGRAYLKHLRAFLAVNRGQWKADERTLLLACYNAGPTRVQKSGFDPARLPASAQDYVARVSALHDQYLTEQVQPAAPMLADRRTASKPSRS